MFRIQNKLIVLVLVVMMSIATLGLAGCQEEATEAPENDSNQTEQSEDNKQESEESNQESQPELVEIAYVNWADCVAVTNLAKVILEEEMGYEVDMTMADPGPIYTDIADGEHDVFLGAWLPVTHQNYWNEYEDEVDQINPNFVGARIGVVVPEYVDIDSIEELNDNVDEFRGELIGIDPGAGIMQASREALEVYELDYELVEGSDPAMTAALSDAIEEEKWIAVTGWVPHWKFAEWELKFLEDPEKVYGEEENIYNIARQGLSDDMPEVREFFENYQLSEQKLGELMADIEEIGDDEEAALDWVEEHGDIVDDWTP